MSNQLVFAIDPALPLLPTSWMWALVEWLNREGEIIPTPQPTLPFFGTGLNVFW